MSVLKTKFQMFSKKEGKLLFLAGIFLFSLAFCQPAEAASYYWTTQIVDTGSTMSEPSITFNNSGNPTISYGDTTNKTLKYASYNGSSWDLSTVYSYAGSTVIYQSALAFNNAGNPAIQFGDFNGSKLKFAQYNGSTWTVSDIDTIISNPEASLAFDNSGNPAISYFYAGGTVLKLARYNGSSWNIENVGTGRYTSLDFDSSGNPHISFENSNTLYLADYNGSSWSTQTIAGTGTSYAYTSLELDSSDNPMISYDYYGGSPSHVLKFAQYNGSNWTTFTVNSGPNINGYFNSLALNSSDVPYIAYIESSGTSLASYNGSTWSNDVVDSSTSGSSSIDINNSDNIGIAYIDSNGDLIYASAIVGNLTGGGQVNNVTINGGSGTSGGFSASVTTTGGSTDGLLTKSAYSGTDADFTVASFIGDVFTTFELSVQDATIDFSNSTFTYNYTNLLAQLAASGFGESDLRVFHIGGGGPEQLASTIDEGNNTITFTTSSFSGFGVGVNPEPATLILLGSALLGLLPIRKKFFK